MKKRFARAINVIISFNNKTVVLKDEDDRQTTSDGVELWVQKRPANNIRPMATIPDGTLEIYKHCRPEILDMEWEYYENIFNDL